MMTKWGIFFCMFVLLSVGSVHASAQELRISDFRLPETFFQRLDISFDGGVSRDNEEWPGLRTMSRADDVGNAILRYRLYETNESTVLDLRPSFLLSFAFSEDEEADSVQIRESNQQYARLRLHLPLEGSWYLIPETWFVYSNVSADARSDFESVKYSETRRFSEYREFESYGYDFKAEAGAGFGKIRDGQSVFAILRVLDRLREDSLLVREATREEILLMAQMYSRRSAYLSLFDYPEKHFFGDLVGSLDSLGITDAKSLSAYSILKVADVRLESIVPRLFGWRVRAGLEHDSYQRRWNGTDGRRFDRGSLDFLVLTAEAGVDVSIATHVIASIRRRTSISRHIPKRNFIEAECLLSHELTDRIESSVRYSFQREEDATSRLEGLRTSHLLAGNFMFYLENRTTLTVGARYGRTLTTTSRYGDDIERTNFGASFGLTYRFF